MARGGPRFVSRKLPPFGKCKVSALDGRTLEAKLERQVTSDLTAHVGGAPSVVQRILIARAARLLVMIEGMERHMLDSGQMGDLAGRQLLAYTNSLRQVLVALGVSQPEQAPTSLKSYVGGKAA
jgi:hypothetical protein